MQPARPSPGLWPFTYADWFGVASAGGQFDPQERWEWLSIKRTQPVRVTCWWWCRHVWPPSSTGTASCSVASAPRQNSIPSFTGRSFRRGTRWSGVGTISVHWSWRSLLPGIRRRRNHGADVAEVWLWNPSLLAVSDARHVGLPLFWPWWPRRQRPLSGGGRAVSGKWRCPSVSVQCWSRRTCHAVRCTLRGVRAWRYQPTDRHLRSVRQWPQHLLWPLFSPEGGTSFPLWGVFPFFYWGNTHECPHRQWERVHLPVQLHRQWRPTSSGVYWLHQAAVLLRFRMVCSSVIKREKKYMAIVARYKKEDVLSMARLLACVVNGLEENICDFLGRILHAAGAGWQRQRAVFYSVERGADDGPALQFGAQLSKPEEVFRDKPFITFAEPACGAGAMTLAFASMLKQAGYSPHRYLWVSVTDIDPLAAGMAYIQLSLCGYTRGSCYRERIMWRTTSGFCFTPVHYWRDGQDGWISMLKARRAKWKGCMTETNASDNRQKGFDYRQRGICPPPFLLLNKNAPEAT